MALRISDREAKELGIEAHIPKRVARPRGDANGMNKTEARYARRLDDEQAAGRVVAYWFETFKVKLAEHRCWYTMDFLVQYADRFEVVEIKGGFIRDDAMVKIKVAATIVPFPVYLAQYVDREWTITRIKGRFKP